MTHENNIDPTRETDKPAPAQAEAKTQAPADVAQPAPPLAPQPALDQMLEDLPEPTDEAALYHLLSVC